MSAGAGIAGGIFGAGITYLIMKEKVDRLEAQMRAKNQQIHSLQTEVQIQRNANHAKDNIIAQKDQELKQKDEQMTLLNAEINKLKQERKRALEGQI